MSISRDPMGYVEATKLADVITLQMEATAAKVITRAKEDAVEHIQNLKGRRAAPSHLKNEVFSRSRKIARNAFQEFKASLEELHKGAEGWEDLFTKGAILRGERKYFTPELEDKLAEVMNNALRERGLLPRKDDQGPSDSSGPSNMLKA